MFFFFTKHLRGALKYSMKQGLTKTNVNVLFKPSDKFETYVSHLYMYENQLLSQWIRSFHEEKRTTQKTEYHIRLDLAKMLLKISLLMLTKIQEEIRFCF